MKKKAFSLIELLIVVIIIGVVYTLAITNFQKVGDQSQNITLQTLKKYLQTFPCKKDATFLCLNDCSSCEIVVDNKKIDELNGVFDNFLDQSIEVYRYDFSSGLQERDKKIYFNEEDIEERVCFSYTVDKQGIGDQIIIKFKNNVYDYSSNAQIAPRYKTLDQVIVEKEKLVTEVLR